MTILIERTKQRGQDSSNQHMNHTFPRIVVQDPSKFFELWGIFQRVRRDEMRLERMRERERERGNMLGPTTLYIVFAKSYYFVYLHS